MNKIKIIFLLKKLTRNLKLKVSLSKKDISSVILFIRFWMAKVFFYCVSENNRFSLLLQLTSKICNLKNYVPMKFLYYLMESLFLFRSIPNIRENVLIVINVV